MQCNVLEGCGFFPGLPRLFLVIFGLYSVTRKLHAGESLDDVSRH